MRLPADYLVSLFLLLWNSPASRFFQNLVNYATFENHYNEKVFCKLDFQLCLPKVRSFLKVWYSTRLLKTTPTGKSFTNSTLKTSLPNVHELYSSLFAGCLIFCSKEERNRFCSFRKNDPKGTPFFYFSIFKLSWGPEGKPSERSEQLFRRKITFCDKKPFQKLLSLNKTLTLSKTSVIWVSRAE